MRKSIAHVSVAALAAILTLLPAVLEAQSGAQTRPNQTPSTAHSTHKTSSGAAATSTASEAKQRTSAEATAGKLPIRRVVLYKNGVGYFEHLGRVRGNQDVTIDFTSGQLNDVLKSLTVLDLTGGRITGVDYNSEAPLSQRLGTLRLPLGEKTNLAEFLGALRGARIEVRSGAGTLGGRLLSVEKKTRAVANQTVQSDEISLITDAGEVRTIELGPATSVRIVERDLNQEVGRYLGLLASTREQDLRRMVISTAGAGERQLYVSYISEVPVWKTTYRLVLPSKSSAKPILQGWAIVDNTVGEDWSNVELSLVAGAPQSFIQQLSQPYYARRPVVPLPQSVQLTPQTHQATLERKEEAEAESTQTGVAGGVGGGVAGGILAKLEPPAAPQIVVPGSGAGLGPGSGGGSGGGTFRAGPGAVSVVDSLGKLESAARGQELGDLFEYKLKERVTIRKNQSALVPIVQTDIAAEKVSLWNQNSGLARPLRAVWVTNSSPLTLDGGSFSVLEDETFAGEGLLDPIKPGEKRLLSYAADLGVLVDTKLESEQQRATRVRISHGVMIHTSELRERKTYTVRNEDTSLRSIVIEHPVRAEWKLAEGLKPDETSAGYHRFRLTVEPKKTATLAVNEARPLETRYTLTNLNDDQIALFLRQRTINPDVEQALRRIVAKKNEVAKLDTQIQERQKQINRIFEDQQRLRENLKALKGSAEEKALTQRYTQQLNDQETRLDSLRREMADIETQRLRAQGELDAMIQQVSLDVTL